MQFLVLKGGQTLGLLPDPISVVFLFFYFFYLRVIFFDTPYFYVHGIRQCHRIFSSGQISAFFAKIYLNVVIFNSSLHYQIFKFDTVNRGDFGQIFTIFINIFIMMNSIVSFIWGIVSTMLEHHIHSTLADCYILKYFLLNLVQSHHGLRGNFGHTNIYGFPK